MAEPKMLSEAEAWREIARSISQSEPSDMHFILTRLTELRNEGRIRPTTRLRAADRYEGYQFFAGHALKLAGPVAQNERVLGCLLLALEAEDDARLVPRDSDRRRLRR